MKAIRRSLKGDKEPRPQHVSITPKSAIAIVPPRKVIKALYDYVPDPRNEQELSFHKGDFFHVISREEDTDWYEACNPLIPSARGLVPVSYFEVIGKNERQSAGSAKSGAEIRLDGHDSGYSAGSSNRPIEPVSTNTTRMGAHARNSSLGRSSGAMVYGIVQYDFNAERPDELEAKAGEAIIVIAQSNPEWFVAKPIGRLGGPGLIPVSFIEVRDMTSGKAVDDPLAAVQRAGVPKVEEWKKMAAEYKNSSITLGKFDVPAQQGMASNMERMSLTGQGQQYGSQPGTAYVGQTSTGMSGMANVAQQSQPSPTSAPGRDTTSVPSQRASQSNLLAPVSASIPRYCFDNDMYWFIIECQMEDGRHWELSRYYADFYDMQIDLLKEFPEEAGQTGKQRILPYMPGPVAHITDAISNGRRQNLDEYIKNLLTMPPYISRCQLVKSLFAPRPGDFEIDPNAANEDYRLSGAEQQSPVGDGSRNPSRQSQRGQANPGSNYGNMGPPPPRAAHQRGQSSLSAMNGGMQYRAVPGEPQMPAMNRQASSLTQASTGSGGNATPSTGGALKVKVFFQEDILAIRVPSDITFQQLKDKLVDRLKVNEDIIVQYKDEPTNNYAELNNDNDLDIALQRNTKLTLYVNYASGG